MSIWNINEKMRKIKTLDKNIEVETLIIGAGMTGLMTAYYLKNQKGVCVVDASMYGHGVTLNTTAKITYLQGRVYTKIIDNKGYDVAVKYLNSQFYAIKEIKNIIEREKIDCNFENVLSYVFANKKKEIDPLKREIKFLKENDIKIKEKKLPSKITAYKSFCVSDTYIFNPLKFLDGIYKIVNKKIPIYENTKILKIDKNKDSYICYSDKYHIKAKKIILACHYPFFLYPFLLPLKASIEKSYIIVSKVNKNGNYNCISSSNPTYSSRFYEDETGIYQISLSESHGTFNKQNDKYHFERVKKIFKLNKGNIVMKYSNVDIMTPDNLPYIGQIKDNMYIALGYNTWGMTNSILAAKIISDDLKGFPNNYQYIFNPKRTNLFTIPYYMMIQMISILKTKIKKNKKWYPDNVYIKDNLGVYVDENNKKHIINNKCPHLGCSLIFNEIEKTWDCPCHSSRFDMDGKCIKGPSKYDISISEENT